MKADKLQSNLVGERQSHHILLVNPPWAANQEAGSGRYLSVGVVLIGTILRNAGYRVTLIDGSIDRDYQELFAVALRSEPHLFVGFSVMSSQVGIAYEMSLQAKATLPSTPIVWGGFHPTIYPEQTASDPSIDYVVAGEGINAVVPLADYICTMGRLDDVRGVYYSVGDEVRFTGQQQLAEFNQIPDIDWSLLNQDVLERVVRQTKNNLGQTARTIVLLTGLGCNFKCAFCFNNIFGLKHRTMDADRIVANLKRLKEQFSVEEVLFYDENFFGDEPRALRLVELLEKENLGIRFFGSMRASDIRRKNLQGDFFERLRAVGGYNFGVGAESGSERILRMLRKGIHTDDILATARLGRDKDIVFNFSFMAGLPGETVGEVFDTLHLIHKVKQVWSKHVIIGPQVFRPYPGSDLFREAVAKGLTEPLGLREWATSEMLTHFRRVGSEKLPWVMDHHLFERVITVYNLQSDNAYIAGLQSIMFWSLIRPWILSKGLPTRWSPAVHKVSNWVTRGLVWLCTLRIQFRMIRWMPEIRLLQFLERAYFTEV